MLLNICVFFPWIFLQDSLTNRNIMKHYEYPYFHFNQFNASFNASLLSLQQTFELYFSVIGSAWSGKKKCPPPIYLFILNI